MEDPSPETSKPTIHANYQPRHQPRRRLVEANAISQRERLKSVSDPSHIWVADNRTAALPTLE